MVTFESCGEVKKNKEDLTGTIYRPEIHLFNLSLNNVNMYT